MVRRIRYAALALLSVLVIGTLGYLVLGFPLLDAIYQTVTTVTTVGFREVHELSPAGMVFTILLVLVGVGTALYTLGVMLEALVEGHLRQHFGRRRMARDIGQMSSHVIICGWGRVGRSIARYLAPTGQDIVVIDRNPARLEELRYPNVLGDVTEDATLRAAGIEEARVLVAALDTDADNVFVTLSSRALRPDLVIIARARNESSEPKLRRAGADRVVNPQRLGGQRIAAFAMQPHVVEFLDVVMHEGSLEFRMEEIPVPERCPLAERTLQEARLQESTGALLLAIREGEGPFMPNPSPGTCLHPGSVLIAIGTMSQLAALRHAVERPSTARPI